MDIEGLGERTVVQLTRGRSRPRPGRHLLAHRRPGRRARGFARISAEKLVAAIDGSRDRPLPRVLTALGIRNLGPSASQALAKAFGTLRRVFDATDAERAGGRRRGRRDRRCARTLVRAARRTASSSTGSRRRASTSAARRRSRRRWRHGRRSPRRSTGKAVVVTGAVPGYTREGAEEAIVLRGGTSPGSVEQEDVRAGGRRGRRGQQAHQGGALGIPQVAAERFEELLASGELPSCVAILASDDVERPGVAARALAALLDLPVDHLCPVQTASRTR